MVDLLIRRRMMCNTKGGETPIVKIITWSGSGADKTSSVIDATLWDAYYTLPFVIGASQLVPTATKDTLGVKHRCSALYTDYACTQLVGYYNPITKEITSTRPNTANSPFLPFDEELLIVPRGYYAKMMTCRSGSDAFSSNGNFLNYINAYAVSVILK